MRRNKNCIWDIKGADGISHSEQGYILDAVEDYLKEAYKQDHVNNLADQLNIIKIFPCFVSPEESLKLDMPVTMEEV